MLMLHAGVQCFASGVKWLPYHPLQNYEWCFLYYCIDLASKKEPVFADKYMSNLFPLELWIFFMILWEEMLSSP